MPVIEYELWDMESANRLAAFPTRQEALELVDEMFRQDGPESVASLALGELYQSTSGDIELRPIAQGGALLAQIGAATHAARINQGAPVAPGTGEPGVVRDEDGLQHVRVRSAREGAVSPAAPRKRRDPGGHGLPKAKPGKGRSSKGNGST